MLLSRYGNGCCFYQLRATAIACISTTQEKASQKSKNGRMAPKISPIADELLTIGVC